MPVTNISIVITGTHLTPALALIDELQKHHWSVIYLGRKKLSAKLLAGQPIKQLYITSGKLQRFNWFYSLLTGIKLPLGWLQALYHLQKLKPAALVSFGGYVSVPVCFAAKCLRIPIIIHEQTLAAGLANKLVAPLADKISISWPDSRSCFPPAKTVLTGNPIRQPFFNLKRKTQPTGLKTLFISGGSQGSRFINKLVTPILNQLLKQYYVIHQFGLTQSAQDWQAQKKLRQQLPPKLRHNYQLQRWYPLNQLVQKLSQADLVLSRAGINTVTELAVLDLPALLIPLPHTQKGEQLTNACFLARLGLARVLHQSQLTSDQLASRIQSTMANLDQFKLKPKLFDKKLIAAASTNLYLLILEVISAHK